MSPSPELAAVLASIQPESVSGCDSVELLRAIGRQENADTAATLRMVVEVALRRPGSVETVERLQVPHQFAADEVRAAFGLSATAAEKKLALAWSTVKRLPELNEAMASGGLDETRAWAFADWTEQLSDSHAHAVCAELLPHAVLDAEEQLPTGHLIKEMTKKAMALDPTWAERRYTEAVRKRRVIGYANPDGTANISGQQLELNRAAAACGRITALARSAKKADDPRPIDHLRTELFVSMLDGTYESLTDPQILHALAATLEAGADGGDAEPESTEPESAEQAPPSDAPAPPMMGSPQIGQHLSVRLTTLLGLDRVPAELRGWAPINAHHARVLASLMGGAQWRYALTDDDGHYLGSGLINARPSGLARRDPRNHGIVDILLPASLLRDVIVDPTAGADLIEPYLLAAWLPVLHELTDALLNPAAVPDDSDRRLPGAALRRAVELEKPRCLGIGCGRASHSAEIDHRVDWALGGRTIGSNLGPACGHDHALKTKGGWSLHRWKRRGYRWCTPLGREYVVALPRVIAVVPPPAGPDVWWQEPDESEPNPNLDHSGVPWQESEIWFPRQPRPEPSLGVPAPSSVDLEEPPF
ncbi:MAG TPA: DUF222 domain-containing protein [Sporichthyaceae bacterium]